MNAYADAKTEVVENIIAASRPKTSAIAKK
jgi:hypothetical protein